MFVTPSDEINEELLKAWAKEKVLGVARRQRSLREKRTEAVMPCLQRVLEAFSQESLGTQHFASMTGSGHDDYGRELIDRVFARVLGAQRAAVRLQLVSGTHAIAAALFGVLRPGDQLLSVTGRPYETLEEVIGLRGSDQGSLMDFGVLYEELSLDIDGRINFISLEKFLEIPRKMIFIQRSCGYSWRPSLSIDCLEEICARVHHSQPECVCFVDNCYGEFVEEREPCEVGADLIAGSLIKNLGGTIVPTGGYLAGRSDLVEQACCRLTAPGIGINAGTGFDLNRLILQGLFLAPQMVAEALIGADLVAGVFEELGFMVQPSTNEERHDVIQAVQLGDPLALQVVCKAFQRSSPVGAYLDPLPASMPGYENDLVMAGGTFVDGSTSEFSADAPLKPPYNLFVQGGTHHSHIQIGLIRALCDLVKAGFLDLPQTG